MNYEIIRKSEKFFLLINIFETDISTVDNKNFDSKKMQFSKKNESLLSQFWII